MGKRKTHDEFIKDCKDKRLDFGDYEIIGKYIGAGHKILVRHLKCNREYDVSSANFLHSKVECKICQGSAQKTNAKKLGLMNKVSSEEYLDYFKKLVNDEYTLISTYVDSKTKITIKHNTCGRIYDVLPTTFQKGSRCRKCQGILAGQRRGMTHEEFLKKSSINRNDLHEYTFLSRYSASNKPINIKHICGREYTLSKAGSFTSGSRCSRCANNESTSFRKILEYLDSLEPKIVYKTELQIEGLRNIRNLRCDIGILSSDNKLLGVIEFDGYQHYHPVRGRDRTSYYQMNDNIKTRFCKDNNIPLLRIPYYNFKKYKTLINKFLSSTTIENHNFYFKKNSKILMSRVGSKANVESKHTPLNVKI